MVRKMAYIGSFWLIGLFLASFLSFSADFAAAAFVIINASMLLLMYKSRYMKYCVCALSFAAAMFLYGLYDCFVYQNVIKYDGCDVEVVGEITGYADHSGDKASYTIKGVINGDVKATVTCYADSIRAGVGDNIRLIGKASVFTDSYTFPAVSYYRSKGIFLRINGVSKLNYSENDGISLIKIFDSYRERIIEVINSYLGSREQAIMSAMLFGDRSDLESADKTLMTRAGIGHIMAVSGVHLAVVCALFRYIISLIPIHKTARFGIMLIPIGCFVLLAGMSNSVLRSAVMIIIVYGAELFRRRADTFNSLGIAVIVLTAGNPFAVRDPSFLLSVAGVFGAGVAAPAAIKFLEEKHTVGKIARSVIVPLCVNAVIFPAAVMFFDEFSVIAPLSNLLLLPVCEIILVLGIIVTVTGGVSVVAMPVLKIADILCGIVISVSEFVGNIHFLYIPLGNVIAKSAAIAVVIAVAAAFAVTRRADVPVILSVCVFMLTVTSINIYRVLPDNKMTVSVMSSGRSVAVIVHDRKSAGIIDLGGGGKSAPMIVKYLDRSGISRIDALVVNEDVLTAMPVYSDNFGLFDISASFVPEEYLSYAAGGCQGETVSSFDNNGSVSADGYDIASDGGNVVITCNGAKILFYPYEYDNADGTEYAAAVRYCGKEPVSDPDTDVFAAIDPDAEVTVRENRTVYIGENITFTIDEKGNISPGILGKS